MLRKGAALRDRPTAAKTWAANGLGGKSAQSFSIAVPASCADWWGESIGPTLKPRLSSGR